jgi:hypothetical protein
MARRALTDPANLGVAAAVALAAVLLSAWWLLAVAAVAYAALVAVTTREHGARLGRAAAPAIAPPPRGPAHRLSPPIARRLAAGLDAADAIRAAIAEADVPLDDVAEDVAGLRAAMESLAARADRVHRYLAANDPAAVRARLAVEEASDDTVHGRIAEALAAQRDALDRLRSQLDRLLGEMDHITVALQAIQSEVLSMAAMAGGWEGRELSSRVGELQDRVGALGEGLEEVYAETRVSVGGG